MKKQSERRIRDGKELRELTRAEGHVMCRFKGLMVFVMDEKDWNKLPLSNSDDRKRQ